MSVAFRGTVVAPDAAVPEAAEIHLHPDAIVATTAAGAQHRVALGEAELTSGGFDGSFVFCRPREGGATICTNDPAFVSSLRELGSASAEPLARLDAQRAKRRRGRWLSFGMVAGVLALVVALLLSVPSLLAASVALLPTSIDRQVGDAAFKSTQLPGPIIHDQEIEGFVRTCVARLSPHVSRPGFAFRVVVVQSKVPNAMALPGGQIIVFTGLIDQAQQPEQVAGVLAHEMAHVTGRHGMRNVAHSAGVVLGLQLLLGDAQGWLALAAEVGRRAMQNGYSRDQESEADAEAVRTMKAAGLDPEGLARFFESMKSVAGSELPGGLGWLSTHPDHQARIDHVHALARELPPRKIQKLDVDWQAVKQAVRR